VGYHHGTRKKAGSRKGQQVWVGRNGFQGWGSVLEKPGGQSSEAWLP
jgi:hypothetical protein